MVLRPNGVMIMAACGFGLVWLGLASLLSFLFLFIFFVVRDCGDINISEKYGCVVLIVCCSYFSR